MADVLIRELRIWVTALILSEGRTQTNGFYGYFLTANQKPDLQRKTFESKLHNLFSYIHSVKNKNGTHENGVKVEKNAKESGDKKPEENYANLEAIINADHNAKFNNTTKDIDKDNEDYGKKTDEYEDQIADASEYVETRVEYHEALKEKETTSLFKESSQLVLEKSKTKVSEHSKTKQQTQNGDKDLETHNDKLNTKDKDSNITIFNPESTVKSETTTNASNKKTRDIIVQELNYKDPCNPKTTEDYNNNESTTEDNVVIESPVKEVNGVKPIDRPKPKVNVLNLLGTTYRIGRIISAFHQNKEKSIFKKLKHGFFKTTTTTPKSIFNQIKFKLMPKNRLLKRQKRFLPFLKRSEDTNSNMLTKVLEFLVKNRKNVLPVFMVMREINTLVKSSNGELNHSSKEQNSYIGGSTPPVFEPVTYTLELGGENKVTAFIKRLVGIAPKGDRLTIGSGK